MKSALAITILFLIAVLINAVVAGPVVANIITVEADGSGDVPSIQHAVNAAAVNDTILLGPGVFKGGGNRGIRVPEILAAGSVRVIGAGVDVTIIDCESLERGFLFELRTTSAEWLFQDFTITNGNAKNAPLGNFGGGIWLDRFPVTFENVKIENCTAGEGGGVFLVSSNTLPTFRNCEIEGCVATGATATSGGGGVNVWKAKPNIIDCEIHDNMAANGGGLLMAGEGLGDVGGTYSGNVIYNNTATAAGGGMKVFSAASTIVITDNVLHNNLASDGGGMYLDTTNNGTIHSNTVVENTASGSGAGLAIAGGGAAVSQFIVANNQGAADSGIECSGGSAVINCSITWNPALTGDGLTDCGGVDNMIIDPQFCGDVGSNNWLLQFDSPATAANSACLQRIGAKNIGCALTPVAILSFRAVAEDARVRLESTFSSDLTVTGINVYRGAGDGPMISYDRLSSLSDHDLEYVDTNVEPGAIYRYQIGVLDYDGEVLSPMRTVTLPFGQFRLEQNTPNPFNPTTEIRFAVVKRGRVRLNVYNTRGERVATLVDQVMKAGKQTATWEARGMPSGIYFYRLESGKQSLTRKMLLLK